MTRHEPTLTVPEAPPVRWYRTWKGLIVLTAVAGGALYLSVAHPAHTLAALPWAVLLLCPLMHLFMHGRHR